jgi:flagellar M-ring protein FliF
MDSISTTSKQVADVFNSFDLRKKVFLILTVLFTVGTLVALVMWAQKTDFEVLFSGLSSEDAGEVIEQLRDGKIPYKIGPGGTTIMVPKNQVYEVRMQMASKGFPQSGGMGYELFDQQSIGVTEFVQKINFKRALQGELSRTVNEIRQVKRSRVHLTLPEKSLYLDEQEKPSASVALTIHGGRTLNESQLQGISHLIASSVENLDPENVIIIDSHGKLLSGGEEDTLYGSSNHEEIQKSIERRTEGKVVSMLAGVVGRDKVTAKVSALMDFTQEEQTEESYDPEASAVRSEQSSKEKSKNRKPAASGVPGVMSNSPEIQGGVGEQEADDSVNYNTTQGTVNSTEYDKSQETINYEISRVTRKIVKPTGTITRLSTAVLIDGTYKVEKAEEGNEVRTYVPRTDEEMKKYKNLIERAVGFNEDRGDSIEVVNIQFKEVEVEENSFMDKTFNLVDWQSTVKYFILGLLFIIFIFVALKPMIKILSKTVSEIQPGRQRYVEGAVSGQGDLGELPALGESELSSNKQRQITDFAKKNPRLFSQYIKTMMR